ncbi:hypothetical protein [Alkalibacillus aidingensis]|uniref:hypothetical protein n=1 Tax=Alkalibacillus aidingensis TaxID=2747607 RepID=UPI001660AF3E|nr:hypothetical protein [Alkalibacillus aidingensis]
MSRMKIIIVAWLSLFVLTACTQSTEDVLNEADKHLKDVFLSNEQIDTNYSFKQFDIYKPDELEVVETSDHNIIFSNGNQPFVLLINEFESPNSKWFYNQISEEDSLHLRTYESDDAFAYLHAVEREDENEGYEIHVGIGGVKMSTITEVRQMSEDVEMMIQMIKSVEEN